ASASSYLTFVALLQPADAVPSLGFRPGSIDLTELGGAALLGVLAGLSGRGFAWLVKLTKDITAVTSLWKRVAVAALVLGGLVLLSDAAFDEPLSLGPGVNAIEWVTDPDRSLALIALLFAIRVTATLAT